MTRQEEPLLIRRRDLSYFARRRCDGVPRFRLRRHFTRHCRRGDPHSVSRHIGIASAASRRKEIDPDAANASPARFPVHDYMAALFYR